MNISYQYSKRLDDMVAMHRGFASHCTDEEKRKYPQILMSIYLSKHRRKVLRHFGKSAFDIYPKKKRNKNKKSESSPWGFPFMEPTK